MILTVGDRMSSSIDKGVIFGTYIDAFIPFFNDESLCKYFILQRLFLFTIGLMGMIDNLFRNPLT